MASACGHRRSLYRARLEHVTCVGFTPLLSPALGGARVLRAQACADEGPLHAAVVPNVATACRPDGSAVADLVAPRVARLVAMLGDGRREAVAVHALPGGFGGRRAFAFAEAPETAVRSVRTRQPSARPLTLPAATAQCGYSGLTALPGSPGVGLPEFS